jgi:hypothetical protein
MLLPEHLGFAADSERDVLAGTLLGITCHCL